VKILTRSISGLSDASISKIVSVSFNELGAKNADIINTISSNSIITKNIEIPSIDPQEIKEIINLQAGRHTPYSREEIIVDYVDIGVYKRSYTKILLVIVARNIVDRQYKILEKAGLKLENVFFAPESFAWFVTKILKLENADSPVNVIHVDEDATDFAVFFKYKVMFLRSIPIGARQLMDDKEKYYAKFSEELKKSFEAYQSENIEKSPYMAVLTGAVGELNDLETVLSNTLRLPVRTLHYFKNLLVSSEVLQSPALPKNVSFFNIITTLFASQELKIDLTPDEIKLKKSLQERGRDLIKTGVFVLTIFILIFSILISGIYFRNTQLKSLNARFQPLDQEAQVLAKDFAKVTLIRNYLSKRGYSLEVLMEVYSLIPLEIEANEIRFDEQGKFSLKGTAESMSVVFSFVDSMGKSKYFKDVKTKYTTKRKDGTRDVTDFELAALLSRQGS
jgi:type IV pilus assembly protein PilM